MRALGVCVVVLTMLACTAKEPAPARDSEPEAQESQSTAQLENTYWKLMTLDGVPMETPEGAREIHFVLHSEGKRVAGFSGCNQMMGNYQLSDAKIDFSQVGGTLMACENGMEQEQKFMQLFARVAGWKIAGETLQLLDGADAVLATFESRYLR